MDRNEPGGAAGEEAGGGRAHKERQRRDVVKNIILDMKDLLHDFKEVSGPNGEPFFHTDVNPKKLPIRELKSTQVLAAVLELLKIFKEREQRRLQLLPPTQTPENEGR